uniref:THAP9-like helix-turn-helix domain-containing protein n=1 Tax=Phlebotomus papatasi TaxID=29031 RepID=A0A1B0DII0_PHLPP
MQDSGIAEVQSYCNVNYSLNMDDFNDGGGFLASTINHDHNYVQRHPAEKIDSMDVDPDVEMEIPEIPSINPETSKSREFYKNLAEFEKVSVNRALTSTPNLSQSTSPTKPYLWHKKLQVLREYIKPKKRAVKRLQTKCKRQSNSLMNAKEVIKELRQKNLLNEETMEKLDTLTEFQKELLNLTLNKKRSKQISPAMKKFALNLNYYGPQGYNYVRKELGQMLPHSSTIARWYKSVDSAPGFSSEALKAIQNAQEFANHQLFVHLSFDEMSIRKQHLKEAKNG